MKPLALLARFSESTHLHVATLSTRALILRQVLGIARTSETGSSPAWTRQVPLATTQRVLVSKGAVQISPHAEGLAEGLAGHGR